VGLFGFFPFAPKGHRRDADRPACRRLGFDARADGGEPVSNPSGRPEVSPGHVRPSPAFLHAAWGPRRAGTSSGILRGARPRGRGRRHQGAAGSSRRPGRESGRPPGPPPGGPPGRLTRPPPADASESLDFRMAIRLMATPRSQPTGMPRPRPWPARRGARAQLAAQAHLQVAFNSRHHAARPATCRLCHSAAALVSDSEPGRQTRAGPGASAHRDCQPEWRRAPVWQLELLLGPSRKLEPDPAGAGGRPT
jgi:hypothetical protein